MTDDARRERASVHRSEHAEQALLFQWAALATGRLPELVLLHAIPNFAGRLGKLTALHGARLKAEGRKKGVPDISLPVPRGTYHGLYIELKAQGGRPTPEQKDWLYRLQAQGYAAHLCIGWEDARETLISYLALPNPAK